MEIRHSVAAIIPCNNLNESEAFYARLGLKRSANDVQNDPHLDYRILHDGMGGSVHLTSVVPGWVAPDRNAFGVYVYTEHVDELASEFPGELLGRVKRPEDKPWGMYEFAVSDPNGTLVRIGWPTRLRG